MEKRREKDSKDSLEQEILELVRLKLYQRMRGLGPLLGALEFRTEAPKRAEEKGRFYTDGKIFYLDGKRLRAEFLEDSGRLCLELLHMLYGSLFIIPLCLLFCKCFPLFRQFLLQFCQPLLA